LEDIPDKNIHNNAQNYHNKNKIQIIRTVKKMIIIDKLINRLKMKNSTHPNPGNVYVPKNFEVEERKEDVDANEK
jgi:hypothetical protein